MNNDTIILHQHENGMILKALWWSLSEENVDTPNVVNLQTLDLQVVDISDTSTFHSFCGLNFENFTQLRTLRVSFIGHPPNLSPYKTLQNQLPTSLQEFEWNISGKYLASSNVQVVVYGSYTGCFKKRKPRLKY